MRAAAYRGGERRAVANVCGADRDRSEMPLVWTYMYTTMEGQNIDQDFDASDFKAPMAGFGYGLPLSRLVSVPFAFCPHSRRPARVLCAPVVCETAR